MGPTGGQEDFGSIDGSGIKEGIAWSNGRKWGNSKGGTAYGMYIVFAILSAPDVRIDVLAGSLQSTLCLTCFQ